MFWIHITKNTNEKGAKVKVVGYAAPHFPMQRIFDYLSIFS